ncbi:hypothetical protein [Longimycelium tulufanense]|uniref:hypothetical protein n=1 Tax=Longimycelium tulufanense TaxID=907463 RepID=UPI00166BA777|nr:hypothetical protein [Longimycelium tulufanense]
MLVTGSTWVELLLATLGLYAMDDNPLRTAFAFYLTLWLYLLWGVTYARSWAPRPLVYVAARIPIVPLVALGLAWFMPLPAAAVVEVLLWTGPLGLVLALLVRQRRVGADLKET